MVAPCNKSEPPRTQNCGPGLQPGEAKLLEQQAAPKCSVSARSVRNVFKKNYACIIIKTSLKRLFLKQIIMAVMSIKKADNEAESSSGSQPKRLDAGTVPCIQCYTCIPPSIDAMQLLLQFF